MQIGRQIGVGVLGIHPISRNDFRRSQGLTRKVQPHAALEFMVFAQPHGIAFGGRIGCQRRWTTIVLCIGSEPQRLVLDVVVAPVKTFCPLNPFVAAAAVQGVAVTAQGQQGDFVAPDVAQHPLGGTQAVVIAREHGHGAFNAVGILLRLTDARRQRHPANHHGSLIERGFGQQQARLVDDIVHAAVDTARRRLHHKAVTGRRLDLHPHVVEIGRVQVVHGDVAKHDLTIGRGRPIGHKGIAALGATALLAHHLQAFGSLPGCDARCVQRRIRRNGQGIIHRIDFVGGVDGDDVKHIQRPRTNPRPGRRCALGNALHLLHLLGRKAAVEQLARQLAVGLPGMLRAGGAPVLRQRPDVAGDFCRQQAPVLQAACMWLTLDMHDRPAGLWIAPALAPALHGARIGRMVQHRIDCRCRSQRRHGSRLRHRWHGSATPYRQQQNK